MWIGILYCSKFGRNNTEEGLMKQTVEQTKQNINRTTQCSLFENIWKKNCSKKEKYVLYMIFIKFQLILTKKFIDTIFEVFYFYYIILQIVLYINTLCNEKSHFDCINNIKPMTGTIGIKNYNYNWI